jgi:acyl dehydratase
VQITEFKPGDRITTSSFSVETDAVKEYVEAVEESSGYFTRDLPYAVAPPLACAGVAAAACLKDVEIPEGTIHLSQEIRLGRPVRIGQRLHCQSTLIRNEHRRNIHTVTVRLEVVNDNGEKVLEGSTSFILPNGIAWNDS